METTRKAAAVGVTGFIGRGLPILLKNAGYDVTGISRTSSASIPGVETWQKLSTATFANHQAIINLAGDRIDRRWTAENRRRQYESRIGVTRGIVDSIRSLSAAERPKLLVNASAVGYYGDRGDEILDESANTGNGYLAELCSEWEKAANQAKELGLRVINLRIGIVLGRDGAAFRKLLTVFKLGIGGRLGSGSQWMPWIHIDDLRAAILHTIECEQLDGPVNGCAPNPLRNADFTRQLAKSLHRPAIFPVPGIALKIALGGFGGALLAGQRCMPNALISSGFKFRFPSLDSALTNLLNATPRS